LIFDHILNWDSLSIQQVISDHLDELNWKVDTSLGFADSGQSAFIITARKEKYVILINLENEEKQIRIQAGIDGKYLPKGKQIPKFAKVFKSTKIIQASNYFEEILEDLK
jgi:hypothetical protein